MDSLAPVFLILFTLFNLDVDYQYTITVLQRKTDSIYLYQFLLSLKKTVNAVIICGATAAIIDILK